MEDDIRKVAIIGAGTMGAGIAALCAEAGLDVVLLDIDRQRIEAAITRMSQGRPPMLDDPKAVERIETALFPDEIASIEDADWVCEAIIEDLQAKRTLLELVDRHRKTGSIVTTNTSGIPLRDHRQRRRSAETGHRRHPFLHSRQGHEAGRADPGRGNRSPVIDRLQSFLSARFDKGVVHAKDTVNFIDNRIGCFWMLAGLHKAGPAMRSGIDMETIDALVGPPFGIPKTGLFGLLDLIGLDVLDLVAKNLAKNLPEGDPGRPFACLPDPEQAMLRRGQLGRKTGDGFYRLVCHADGSRSRETFDPAHQDP